MRVRMLEQRVAGPAIRLFGVAAVPLRARRLRLTVRAVGWAIETDMEVPIVSKPRLNFAQPRAIVSDVAAQRLLDGGVHEDAVDAGVLGRGLDQRDVGRAPHLRI